MAILRTTRRLRSLLACACLTLLPAVAMADWMNGEVLHVLYLGYSSSSQGKGPSEYEASGTYFGYVIGVINATDALAKDKIYCLPPSGASSEQLTHVVGAYLVANPGERSEPAMALIYKALKRAFPCR